MAVYIALLLIYTEKEIRINTSNLDSTTQKILSGKPEFIPTWQLKIVVTPLISIANNLFSADTHFKKFSHTMYPADDLQVSIGYNDSTIDLLNFLNNQPQERIFALNDTREIIDHTVTVTLSGKHDNHSYHTDTYEDVSWVLKLDLYIENFLICGLFLENETPDEYLSDFYIGENSTHILKIQTPIYRWLFQQEDRILRPVVDLKNSNFVL